MSPNLDEITFLSNDAAGAGAEVTGAGSTTTAGGSASFSCEALRKMPPRKLAIALVARLGALFSGAGPVAGRLNPENLPPTTLETQKCGARISLFELAQQRIEHEQCDRHDGQIAHGRQRHPLNITQFAAVLRHA